MPDAPLPSVPDPPERAGGGGQSRRHRWLSPQPNVPGRGIVAAYSLRFWVLVVLLGVVTGAGASALMALLKLTEHLAYGYAKGPYLDGIQVGSELHRVLVLFLAGVIVAAGAAVLHRLPASGGTEVSEALWLRGGKLPLVPSVARGVLSIVTVGMGVSLGREGAPQLTGGAVASRFAEWAELPQWQRRLLVASGAGAGFAAVYNVPLGGALFALEVLLGTVALPLVLPALAVSVIATAVAWFTLGTAHTYHMPTYNLHPALMVWAVLAGPVIGLLAVVWVRIIERANAIRPRGRGRYLAPPAVFVVLALVSVRYPELLGNGKGIVQLALLGKLSLGLFAALLFLKPLATAGCLGAGSPGGLFTPTLTVGVLLAGVLEGAWSLVWPGTAPGSYALIGGGAFLAASTQGPLSALVLVLELTRHFDLLMGPAIVAVTEATIVARRLGAPSIYSARLARDPYGAGERTSAAAIATLDAPAPGAPEQPPPHPGETPAGDGREARP